MNTKSRFLLGLLSSLLLACGFAKAAERLDPMSHQSDHLAIRGVAPDCDAPCSVWPPA